MQFESEKDVKVPNFHAIYELLQKSVFNYPIFSKYLYNQLFVHVFIINYVLTMKYQEITAL